MIATRNFVFLVANNSAGLIAMLSMEILHKKRRNTEIAVQKTQNRKFDDLPDVKTTRLDLEISIETIDDHGRSIKFKHV